MANNAILPDAAVLHAIKEIEKSMNFNHVVFLQPTSPLRAKNDIDKAIRLYPVSYTHLTLPTKA